METGKRRWDGSRRSVERHAGNWVRTPSGPFGGESERRIRGFLGKRQWSL